MIKMIFVGKKDPAKAMAEYKRYYLDHHAPLAVKNSPNMRKYTINFAIERPGREPPFDFITEIWWDNMEDMREFYQSGVYRDIIQPDELKLGGSGQKIYYEEYVQK
jgi:uncharacterized protein (TIGR02118 family)